MIKKIFYISLKNWIKIKENEKERSKKINLKRIIVVE